VCAEPLESSKSSVNMPEVEKENMREEKHCMRLSVPALKVCESYQLKKILQVYFLQLGISLYKMEI